MNALHYHIAVTLFSNSIPALTMDSDSTTVPLHALSARDFFLARQPILDREQGLFAYELLFRSAFTGPANVTDDSLATATVMANAAELGLHTVVGDALAFFNVDIVVLESDFVRFLPPEKVVLEILETVEITPALIARVSELAQLGFKFALDDVVAATGPINQLLPKIDIIKVDIRGLPSTALAALAAELKQSGKKLLAEKVETLEEFEHCVALGFDYFQGYYFAKPDIMRGKKLSPSQLGIVRLMGLIQQEADNTDIEQLIKQDAALVLNLLRLVNSPGAGVVHRIDSIGQAVMILGRLQLQRWLTILLYSEPRRGGGLASPLLILAATRGKLLELISSKTAPGNRLAAERAFTVGIMSLMEALVGLSMTTVLEQIPAVDEIRDALLRREGRCGDMLRLAELLEQVDDNRPQLSALMQQFKLTVEELTQLQLQAFAWSDAIASDVR